MSDPAPDLLLAHAMPVIHEGGEDPTLVRVSWWPRLDLAWCVHAYVDGELAACSDPAAAHGLWLHLDRSRPRLIELLVTAAGSRGRDPPTARLSKESRALRPSVTLIPPLDAPPDTRLRVVIDAGESRIHPLWGDAASGGFGGVFAVGAFGDDQPAAPGLGRGELGLGPLGYDGQARRLTLEALSPGPHTVSLALAAPDGTLRSAEVLREFVIPDLGPFASRLTVQGRTLSWSV
jgi:hypothetical protein